MKPLFTIPRVDLLTFHPLLLRRVVVVFVQYLRIYTYPVSRDVVRCSGVQYRRNKPKHVQSNLKFEGVRSYTTISKKAEIIQAKIFPPPQFTTENI